MNTFGFRPEMIRWWIGIDISTDYDEQSALIDDLNRIMEYAVAPDIIARLYETPGILTALRWAGEEVLAGLLWERALRSPEWSFTWQLGGLEATPPARAAADPGGLLARGMARMRPFLRRDFDLGPWSSVFGVGGKQGSGA